MEQSGADPWDAVVRRCRPGIGNAIGGAPVRFTVVGVPRGYREWVGFVIAIGLGIGEAGRRRCGGDGA